MAGAEELAALLIPTDEAAEMRTGSRKDSPLAVAGICDIDRTLFRCLHPAIFRGEGIVYLLESAIFKPSYQAQVNPFRFAFFEGGRNREADERDAGG